MPNETFAEDLKLVTAEPTLVAEAGASAGALFESAPGSYVVLLPDDFTVVAASKAYLADTMTKRGAIINRSLFEVFPDDDENGATAEIMPAVRRSLERVRDTHAAHIITADCYPARCPWSTPESDMRLSRIINSPVFSASGKLIFIIHRIQQLAPFLFAQGQKTKPDDVRQWIDAREQLLHLEQALRSYDHCCTNDGERTQERLRKSEAETWPGAAQFRELANSMPDKILTARPNGEIDYFNRRWIDFTGLPSRDLDHADWPQLVHPDDVAENIRAWKHCVASGEFFEFEHRVRRADGAWRWHISHANPMRNGDGRIVAWIASSTEIDAMKRVQAEAEEANRAKDQFLATLSHELRMPLTPVLMCAAALERETALQPRYRKQLGMMRRHVELEARLIDDLFDVSRISRGKLTLNVEKADIHEILRQTYQIVRSDARAKNSDLRLALHAAEHHVLGDSDRLHQVCWNLIKNAIKFTPSGGQVSIVTSNPLAGRVRLEVIDNGIGIDPAFLGSVFQAFRQASGPERRTTGGLGLGMSISKAIVELHGGMIDVRSEGPGKGTTVTVEFTTTLPRYALSDLHDSEASTPNDFNQVGQRSLRLLLVEDHAPTLEVLAKLLRKAGHDVALACTVSRARELASAQAFDLVISDLGLPDGNGEDLLVDLTRDHGLRGIALSGYGMQEDLARTKNAGFIAHLIKPVDFEDLKTVLAAVAPTLA